MNLNDYLKGVKDKKRKKFVETARKMGVKMEVISKDFRLLRLSWKGRTKILYKSKAYFNMDPSTFFTKNKEITKILLRAASIKVPKGIYARDFKKAVQLMRKEKIAVRKALEKAKRGDLIVIFVHDIDQVIDQVNNFNCYG